MLQKISSRSENAIIDEIDRVARQRDSVRLARRSIITGMTAAAAVTGAAMLTGCSSGGAIPLPVTAPTVLDVLNFALNLEYLEASFYLAVANGATLSATDMGTSPGTVSGGAQVAFTSPIVAHAAAELATDEQEHVEFLRATITAVGGTPVSMPNLNLAAMGAVTSDSTFLALARQLENVGMSAYIGGAQFLVTSTTALTYAAQILDTESQHAGLIRELCIALGVTSPAVDAFDNPPTATQIFDTSATTGLSPVRSTSQVLQIVYGTPGITGTASGGFFPNGLNGSIAIS